MRNLRATGFTLIEMLTVIVIIGIVLAMGLPAVTKLMKSGGLSSASRQVANTLGLARQYAITRRTYARVVFPYWETATNGGNWTNRAQPYLAYSVMASNRSSQSWVYVSKWEFLPLGSVFLNNVGGLPTVGALDNANCLQHGLMPYPSTNPAPASGNATLSYVEFDPTGAATPNPLTEGSSILTIQEGMIMNTGLPQTTSANAVTNTIDTLVGRIKITHP